MNRNLIYIVCCILFITTGSFSQEKAVSASSTMKLIYVYDALCGWCYGFSPVITDFSARHASEFAVEVVSGGMVLGERIGPIGEVAPYISWAYKDVEKATGVQFGTAFLAHTLKEGSAIFTSEPAALAMAAFRTHLPQQSLAFAARLQKAIYSEGIPPLRWEAYGDMAAEFGLDARAFVQQLKNSETKRAAQADFLRSNQLGVQGFPTVFLERDGQLYQLSSGYVSLENLEQQYQTALKQ
jgi:putative protein-disulfide isomerase